VLTAAIVPSPEAIAEEAEGLRVSAVRHAGRADGDGPTEEILPSALDLDRQAPPAQPAAMTS
jgi:hypothetical protein